MARKVIIVNDPGIDGAFALALALADPNIDVLAWAATAGNVGPEQATSNMLVIQEMLDPPRFPRIGAALPVTYARTATDLHGPDGLGGLGLPPVQLHHQHPADKVIIDHVRQHPGDVSVLILGPATAFARAIDRDPELCRLVQRVVIAGGTWHEPGDATPVAEFHFWCDPGAAQRVLTCGAPITLLPLDVTRKLVYSPTDLRQLPPEDTKAGAFLRKVVPSALATTAGLYGIEGVHLNDALAVAAFSRPEVIVTRTIHADVETGGELTRGMSVLDARWGTKALANVDLATGVDVALVRSYIHKTLGVAFE
jgi:inosine-uridine nucleoside N-ribohydrolase